MQEVNYIVIYRNGVRTPIANFKRDKNGKFVFEYLDEAPYEFPGFDVNMKKVESETLWEQIAFRIPNIVRKEYPNVPLEELLAQSDGKLITDHFEFLRID